MTEPAWIPLGGGGGGSTVDYLGAWSATVAYEPGAVVRHNGIDYLAVNPSTGQAPPAAVILAQPYALIRCERPSGVSDGNSIAGWQTRTLNTKVVDSHGIVELATNRITLQPGTYRLFATVPQGAIAQYARARWRNMTDGVVVLLSATWFPTSGNVNEIPLRGQFVVAGGPKAFELQHYTGAAVGNGLGAFVSSGDPEVYSVVELWKVA